MFFYQCLWGSQQIYKIPPIKLEKNIAVIPKKTDFLFSHKAIKFNIPKNTANIAKTKLNAGLHVYPKAILWTLSNNSNFK